MRVSKPGELNLRVLAEFCSETFNNERNIASVLLSATFAELYEALDRPPLSYDEHWELTVLLKNLDAISQMSPELALRITAFYSDLDWLPKMIISFNIRYYGSSLIGIEGTDRLKELGFKL